ncbi:DUF4247 domain-containing protein [Mycobacterium sp. NPDC003323]
MTRGSLFGLAGLLGVLGVMSLIGGIVLQSKDVRSHVRDTYRQYSADGSNGRYECTGSPKAVADDIAAYDAPEARASDRGTEYLRYNDDIVTVGPEGTYPCSVRVEDVNDRYSGGAFIFLGPGFTPGSPAGGSGGSSGGPGGTK